jgi:hypothetical protein
MRMLRIAQDAGLVLHRRIIVPYSTQQLSGGLVKSAREAGQMLACYRDLVVMRAP